MVEEVARELPNLPLEDLLQLVHLYAERGSPKFEKAALRWLERYLSEGTPRLQHFAEIATSLAKREPQIRSSNRCSIPARTPVRAGVRSPLSPALILTRGGQELASYVRVEEREVEVGGLN